MQQKLKIILLCIGICLLISNCDYDTRSKKYFVHSTPICNDSFYVERFNVFSSGGAYGGTISSNYLTDSLNFRIFIGTFDEDDEKFMYSYHGDSIIIEKWNFERLSLYNASFSKKLVSRKAYSLSQLKQSKKFE